MRTFALLWAALALTIGSATATATAGVLPAKARAGGQSLTELLAAANRLALESPFETNPLGGDPCAMLTDRIIAPAAPGGETTHCTVPSGTRVLLVGSFAECSDAEDPPFDLAAFPNPAVCPEAFIAGLGITGHTITLDGRTTDLLAREPVTTTLDTVVLPEDNILGVPAQTTRTIASGWLALTSPLSVGQHTIVMTATGGLAESLPWTFVIDVVPRGQA